MSISITCSSCSTKLKAPEKKAGRSIFCPKCQASLLVPSVVVARAVPQQPVPVAQSHINRVSQSSEVESSPAATNSSEVSASTPIATGREINAADRWLIGHRWTVLLIGYTSLTTFGLLFYLMKYVQPYILTNNSQLALGIASSFLITGFLLTSVGHIIIITNPLKRATNKPNPKRQKLQIIAGVVVLAIIGFLLLAIKIPAYLDRQDSSQNRQQWQEENAFYSTADPGFISYDETKRKATMNDTDRMLRSTGQGNSIPEHRRR
jgi:DNA-directed RNA polymerase subunit RPC12/RpoP